MESEFERAAAGIASGIDVVRSTFQSAVAEPGVDWGAVVRRYDHRLQSRVRRVLCRMGLRAFPELVEEVMQEVYCRLLEAGASRLRRCRGGTEAELIAFMGIIAERVVLDHLRLATALKRTAEAPIRLGRMGRNARRTVERVTDPGPTPEEVAVRRERQRLLLDQCRQLRGLGPGRRNAWVMRMAVLEGYSSHEISAAAGGRITPRNIDNLVHRIRRRLAGAGLEVPRRTPRPARPPAPSPSLPRAATTHPPRAGEGAPAREPADSRMSGEEG
jgi:hypothetical protein